MGMVDTAKRLRVWNLFDAGKNNTEAERETLVSRSTIIEYRKAWKREKAKEEQPEVETATPPDELEDAIQKIAKQRDIRREREVLMAVAGEKSFRAYLADLMHDVAPRISPLPQAATPKFQDDTSHETMAHLWSDWHAFEEVKASRVMGFNEFTGRILCERTRRIVLTGLSIKNRMERGGGWLFRNAVIGLNGDFISGTIHELERHSDASNVIVAAFSTGLLLGYAIRELAAHYEHVEINCTSGNHGRLPDARKVQQKDPTRSWDTAIYLYAMTALRDIKNITWHIPESYFAMYKIEGWQVLQFHGHDIKAWNSIPHYGIDRFGRNTQALFNSRKERIDYFLVSHFHTSSGVQAAGGETFINGSIIGGNEFSVGALGKADKPSQWMFTVHPEHGMAFRMPIMGNGLKPVQPYEIEAWPA
jgi:hypothetical protein